MVNALHTIFSKLFGDGFADVVITAIQWISFAAVVYLIAAALGLPGVSLPIDMTETEAIMVMLPLLLIASPNTVD